MKMMKLEDIKKRKGIVVTTGVLLVIVVMIVGVTIYHNNQEEKKIENEITQIANIYDEFTNAEQHEDKVDKFEAILNMYHDYKKRDGSHDEVNKAYDEHIANIRTYFIDEYNKNISENTLQEVDDIDDKSQLLTAIEKLKAILEQMQKEAPIVCVDNEFEDYKSKITELITSYTEQIKAIEETEKKEQEAKKAEASVKQNKNDENVSSNNKDNSSSESNDNGSGSNGGSSSSTGGNTCALIPNTNICYVRWFWEGTEDNLMYITADKDVYDKNGNYLYNTNDFDIWD